MTAGGSVVYTVTLTNNTAQPITYQQQGACGIDGEGAALHVKDAAGNPVYPAPDIGTCTSVSFISPLTLAPGQASSFIVPSPVALTAAGRYFAAATFSVGPVTDTQSTVNTPPIARTPVGPLEADAR